MFNDSKMETVKLLIVSAIGLTILFRILPKLLYGSSRFNPTTLPKRNVITATNRKPYLVLVHGFEYKKLIGLNLFLKYVIIS